jgi:hypothetical protein
MRFFAEPVLNDSEVLRITNSEGLRMTALLLFTNQSDLDKTYPEGKYIQWVREQTPAYLSGDLRDPSLLLVRARDFAVSVFLEFIRHLL